LTRKEPPGVQATTTLVPAASTAIPRKSVYVHPGQLYVSAQPSAATTILGSCVAVCLWERNLGLGGINHYLLPHGTGAGHAALRFASGAITALLNKLLLLGARKDRLQAKIFGGACVLDAFRAKGTDRHLGAKNVDIAKQLLGQEGLPIVAEDVGGTRGRKLIFHTDSGTALVRLI